MFNNKKDDENDFCESYKSQILGTKPSEKENSVFSTIVKLLTILILLAIIIGVSFYGYRYFTKSQKSDMVLPPISMQVFDDELIVEAEEDSEEKIIKEENISLPLIVSPQVEEVNIDQIANDVKIAIAKSEVEEENKTKIVEEISKDINSTVELNISKEEVASLAVPTLSPEAQYLEELADLSKEIDKERKK